VLVAVPSRAMDVRVGVDVVAVAVGVLMLVYSVGAALKIGFRRAAPPGLAGALLAEADDREVGEARLVSEFFLDLSAYLVQAWCGDRGDSGAAVAVEIFDLITAEEDIEARSVAQVDVTDQSIGFEDLEVAVDRRLLDDECPGEVCCGNRALGGEERLQHQAPRSREPEAPLAQRADGFAEIIEDQGRDVGRLRHR